VVRVSETKGSRKSVQCNHSRSKSNAQNKNNEGEPNKTLEEIACEYRAEKKSHLQRVRMSYLNNRKRGVGGADSNASIERNWTGKFRVGRNVPGRTKLKTGCLKRAQSGEGAKNPQFSLVARTAIYPKKKRFRGRYGVKALLNFRSTGIS